MSYILEALKKAQAERQLGATPTIHAPVLHGGDEEHGDSRRRWVTGGAVVAVVALGVGAFVWRSTARVPAPVAVPAAAVPAAAVQTAAPLSAAAPVSAPVVPPAAAQPSTQLAPVTASAPAAPVPATRSARAAPAASAPVMAAAAPSTAVRVVSPVVPALPPSAAVPASTPAPANPSLAAGPAAALASPAAAPPAAPADDSLPLLRGLPDAVQRQIPPVAIGGYIYSRNPEDRLLLVDKVLRHEGEEVAPGLVLEHLLPKAAVFNFRGTRYRAPY
jgi:general secretion pathway protein B